MAVTTTSSGTCTLLPIKATFYLCSRLVRYYVGSEYGLKTNPIIKENAVRYVLEDSLWCLLGILRWPRYCVMKFAEVCCAI